jgi:hypothetical protein
MGGRTQRQKTSTYIRSFGYGALLIHGRFLYIFFLALDACFRLKRRMISNEYKDPGLGTGWAYVMENPPYRHYLLTVTDQKEVRVAALISCCVADMLMTDEHL